LPLSQGATLSRTLTPQQMPESAKPGTL